MYRVFVLFVALFTASLFAQVEFPLGKTVINVTKEPYLAKADGKTDDTQAIQQALNDHPDGDYIIYLPHGIYKISEQLVWPETGKAETSSRRTILQGQSMGGTIIQLADSTYGFDNADFPKAVIFTGMGPELKIRNSVRDMTIRTGKGNPGAIGIQFNAANQGTLSNVKIYSGDSTGVYGVDLSFSENIGPLLIKNVEVRGFNIGIYAKGEKGTITLEHVTLGGQKKVGFENENMNVAARALRFKGGVPAVYNHGPYAMLSLVDGLLEYDPGKKKSVPTTAIMNDAGLFIRSMKISKYAKTIKSKKKGYQEEIPNEIIEFTSEESKQLCHSPKQSMRVAVAETPNFAEQKADNWITIAGDYGGKSSTGSDDSKAIQDAIDDGAETIFFPPGGRWTINRDIYIRNRVRRLIGIEGRIDGKGKFIIEKGAFNELTIERFSEFGSGIIQKSTRSILLKNMMVKSLETDEIGTGDVYLEDVAVGTIQINHQKLWGRQVTMIGDTKGPKITNNGGTIWILGLTAKKGNTILQNFNKANAELIGVEIEASDKAKDRPMFINDNSGLSVTGLRETLRRGNPYHKIVEESRQASAIKSLFGKDLPRNEEGGARLPLFVGYAPKQGANEKPQVTIPKEMLLVQPNRLRVTGSVIDDGRGDGLCEVPVRWKKGTGPGKVVFSDSMAYSTDVSFTASGRYNIIMTGDDGYQTGADTGKIYVFDKKYTTLDHSGDNIPSGRGAATWISEFDNYSPHNTDPEMRVANISGSAGKLYLRYDLSALPGPLFDVALQLDMPDSITKPVQFNIFGLKETSKDMNFGDQKLGIDWPDNELTWENAPANLPQAGGQFNIRKNSGGGVDTKYAEYLGIITLNPKAPLGAFLRTPTLTDFFKRKHSSGLYTLILTAVEPGETVLNSPAAGKQFAPALYVGYFDNTRSVGGEAMDGGYTLTKVQIDIYSLECNFDLTVGYPQFVQIEIMNEFGKRMLTVAARELEGEKKTNFKFKAKAFPTGRYILKVIGEAFTAEQKFYILN
ncbi:MAG: glycoside hydrolase family 55 protein [Fibrobacter sp.]|nr:glycoside hydrolase family 55 protein [Fibrobacter sp.]